MEFPTRPNDCPICGETVEIPADMLGTMAEMPKLVSRSFREPRNIAAGGGWNPHEIAAHLADTEIVTSYRLRRILSEEEPDIRPYDQDLWSAHLFYNERELATSLALYAATRQANLEILRLAGEDALQRRYKQPQHGTLTLGQLITHKADHDIAHLKQIRGE
jgi:hypothetical protein